MQRRAALSWTAAILVAGLSWGCAANSDVDTGNQEFTERQEIEEEFGKLDDSHVEGFERELRAQYRQLLLTYHDYDELRRAPREALDGSHDEHRVHRKLKRRHTTLARYHEDRMWLNMRNDDGESEDDRRLAKIHRGAAEWHRERFEDDGTEIQPQDEELEAMRGEFNDIEAIFE